MSTNSFLASSAIITLCVDQVNEVKEDVMKLDTRLSELVSQLANSASPFNATTNAIQDNINSLFNTQQTLNDDVAALREETTSLRSIIGAPSDDVEKGEGSKKKKQRSLFKRRMSKSPSTSAPLLPPPPPPPSPPSPKKALVVDEQARTSHEVELIEAMTRVGASHEKANNPIIQSHFIFERRDEES